MLKKSEKVNMKKFKLHFRKRNADGDLEDVVKTIEASSKKKAIDYAKSKEIKFENFYFIGLIK